MSSSSEEEEESASSESTHENSKRDESSNDEEADDNQSKSTQASTVKKLDSESESEQEFTQKTKSSDVTKPESSGGKKRPSGDDSEVKKKKLKTGGDEEEGKKISREEAKLMFQRLFSESDEIALLQGIVDFTDTKGDINKDMDGFVDYVKKLIDFNANRSQLRTKIQRMKKRFCKSVKKWLKKGKSEDEIVFSKDLDQKAFDLSRKIWGQNGVLVSKSRKKLLKSVPHSKQETVKANVVLDARIELASFFKTENVSDFALDESELVNRWDMVADGSKKRELEEKLKKLKATQGKLCMQRTGLVAESAKLIFDNING